DRGTARILPLDSDAIALMTSGTSMYIALTIPSRTYPGQRRPIATVGVTSVLVSTTSVDNDEIRKIMSVALGELDYVGRGSPIGALVSPQTARDGLTIPLHSGAEEYFNSLSL